LAMQSRSNYSQTTPPCKWRGVVWLCEPSLALDFCSCLHVSDTITLPLALEWVQVFWTIMHLLEYLCLHCVTRTVAVLAKRCPPDKLTEQNSIVKHKDMHESHVDSSHECVHLQELHAPKVKIAKMCRTESIEFSCQ
jgi:hypothetical protein